MRQRRAAFNRRPKRSISKHRTAVLRRQMLKIMINGSYGKHPTVELQRYKTLLGMMYGAPFQFQGRSKRYV